MDSHLAAGRGDKLALVCVDDPSRRVTSRELAAGACRTGHGLRAPALPN